MLQTSTASPPMVSVIVPNYNHERFLRQRLDSILGQSFQDFELILLDDLSSDGSQALLESYANHPKVAQLCFNERNGGSPYRQWNKGLGLARGRYVWIAESDDYAAPDFLEQLVAVMEQSPGVGIAFCKSLKVDETGREIGSTDDWLADVGRGLAQWQTDFIAGGREEAGRLLIQKCIIPNVSSALIRRETLLAVGGAHAAMRYCGDYLTYVRLLERSDLAYLARPLNYFRFSSQSVRTKMVHSWLHEREKSEVLSEIVKGFEIPKPELECVRFAYFSQLLRISRYDRAFFWNFVRHLPQFQSAARNFCPSYYRSLLVTLGRMLRGSIVSRFGP
ncbi:glycosyl transferase family 2 [Roseateles asaccharophilus]|uniref:Glycosyl transferase family 2 n=2 Tax=Roseateles asaccharophilus TaxID=582607 RepID=A0A4V3CIQ8_9BURK|nr:glycosyl transferase family 2 [Roseateles asaccharophilus]